MTFDKVGADKVRCRLCKVELSYDGVNMSTGGMNNHLKLRHPSIGAVGENQQTLKLFTLQKCTVKWSELISERLTNMIVKDSLPISFVEGGF